jgi:hypothetical protein
MTLNDFLSEFKNWKFTKYKAINFAIGLSALLLYEFVGRPIYRPYIYTNKINDFHIADTLGNTFGTLLMNIFLNCNFTGRFNKGKLLNKTGNY